MQLQHHASWLLEVGVRFAVRVRVKGFGFRVAAAASRLVAARGRG